MPPRAAIDRDECWRNAASTLCLLSSRVQTAPMPLATAPGDDSEGGGRSDGACASLAAPMLVDAAATVLRGWSSSDADELGDASGPRASQIAHLLSLLGSLTLPEGVLPDPAALAALAVGPVAPARSGRRAHLLRLAPHMIECIGQPAHVYASGSIPPSVAELAACVRRLLHLVTAELHLE